MPAQSHLEISARLAKSRPGLLRRHNLLHLMMLGALLEIWLLGLDVAALSPVGRWLFIPSPLAERWPLVLDMARRFLPSSWFTDTFVFNRDWPQMSGLLLLFYGAALTAALAFYAARHIRQPEQRHLLLILAGTLIFGVTLLLIPILPTQDIYTYIFYGRITVLHHANPLISVPNQFPHDPFLPNLYWRDTLSIYGPVWLGLSDGLTWLAEAWGGSLAAYIFFFKSTTLLFHLGNVVVIWAILGVVAPRRRVTGTVLYAWNPLALLEFASSGHNDAVMLFFFLLGVWCLLRRREVLALLAFALSLDVKYALAILLPFYLWYVLRETPGMAAKVRGALWRLGVLVGVCALLYLPYWDGLRTFGAILYAPPTQNNLLDSLLEMIDWPFRRTVAQVSGWPTATSDQVSVTILKWAANLVFLAAWLRLFRTVRGIRRLFIAWWWTLFLYLTIANGWFMPWYVIWLLAVTALYPLGAFAPATLLLAGGVLAYHVLDWLPPSPLHGIRALLAFGPAIAYLLWHYYGAKRRLHVPPFLRRHLESST